MGHRWGRGGYLLGAGRRCGQPLGHSSHAASGALNARAAIHGRELNVYAAAAGSSLSPVVRGVPERIYVPNSESNTVDVIDPMTTR